MVSKIVYTMAITYIDINNKRLKESLRTKKNGQKIKNDKVYVRHHSSIRSTCFIDKLQGMLKYSPVDLVRKFFTTTH